MENDPIQQSYFTFFLSLTQTHGDGPPWYPRTTFYNDAVYYIITDKW